ncbi:hypothetical protein [Mesorhizobium sp. YM1C-6-2]|uniref:hypothetical protein n=1 Tax=Mesorhizobium sp. YM1C-6-2 TaxID=1827501 RepID=UPI001FE1E73D|nr:hypothetical protein [Mesorhizobium sp. YM1C-6-2]
MPHLYGFVAGTDIDIGLRLGPHGKPEIRPERESFRKQLEKHVSSRGGVSDALVFSREVTPPKRLMSRFLGKMALEALAQRFLIDLSLFDRLIDDPHYDRIRDWARLGNNFKDWPISQRQIYPEETLMRHAQTGEWVQAGFGYDIFMNKRRETFFAFCIYGHEFVINVGGPSLKGFEEWLSENNGISPLVERIGASLSERDGQYYLEGTYEVHSGVQFDRKLLGLG